MTDGLREPVQWHLSVPQKDTLLFRCQGRPVQRQEEQDSCFKLEQQDCLDKGKPGLV